MTSFKAKLFTALVIAVIVGFITATILLRSKPSFIKDKHDQVSSYKVAMFSLGIGLVIGVPLSWWLWSLSIKRDPDAFFLD